MKSQMTVGTKLTIGCAAMLALVAGMGGMYLNSVRRLDAELDTATHKTARRLQLAGTMDTAGSDMLAGMRGLIMFTYGKDPSKVEMCRRQFESAADEWQKAIVEVRPLLVRQDGVRLVDQLQQELTAWRAVIVDIEAAAAHNDPDSATRIAVTKGLPIYQENTRDSEAFRAIQNEILDEQRARAAAIYNTSFWTAGGFLCLGVLAGILMLLLVRRMNYRLRRASSELSQASEQVASASRQISTASQNLARGASEQAASIEETSASAEEITATTRKNADDSRQANELMTEASNVVADANRTLEHMEASMNEINASSEKIGRIIKVIDEIAFQTNILALNAAVEAARAGEAGMGFAVVADEVRSLAHRSAQAAKDTAGLIEESIGRSSEGRVKLEEVSSAIHSLTAKAGAVKVLIDGLHVSSAEQARGVAQIAAAVTQVEQVAQNAAANAEEVASAGEELSSQSTALRSLVSGLEAMVGSAT